MTNEEIALVKQAIEERGLQGRLKSRLKIIRKTISADTISRAWQVDDYATASPAHRLVLNTARFVKEEDDERIQREWEEFEKQEQQAHILEAA